MKIGQNIRLKPVLFIFSVFQFLFIRSYRRGLLDQLLIYSLFKNMQSHDQVTKCDVTIAAILSPQLISIMLLLFKYDSQIALISCDLGIFLFCIFYLQCQIAISLTWPKSKFRFLFLRNIYFLLRRMFKRFTFQFIVNDVSGV